MSRRPHYISQKENNRAVLPPRPNKKEKKVVVYLRHHVVPRVPDDPVDSSWLAKVLAVSMKIVLAAGEEYAKWWLAMENGIVSDVDNVILLRGRGCQRRRRW
jgi:hypothetical protein